MKKALIVIMMIGMAACNNTPGTEVETHDHAGHEEQDHHHENSETTTVELNNGQRWEANPETNEGISNMLVLIEDFDEESGDYSRLKQDLMYEFQMIFKKCTMTGEAHDQLHNYLIPLKEKLDHISQDNLHEIEAYLNTYPKYFV